MWKVTGSGPSHITISLPLQSVRHDFQAAADAGRNAAVDRTTVEPDLSGVKVLLVDDEEDSLATVSRILERRGAESAPPAQ